MIILSWLDADRSIFSARQHSIAR